MVLLFVYGSLRQGMYNAPLLRRGRLVAKEAWVNGVLYDTGEGYPGLIAGEGRVWGEVYQITQQELRWVDRLEDYNGPNHPDNLYERISLKVRTPEGEQTAYTYYYRDVERLKQKGKKVASGDWVAYVNMK
ncbi:gamma-glutamylcyclotransferase family protein [Laceyella putida]|uniref:Gamma-glutamylcyclotransferase family protein n=1 Tax=Laceyella putida TaxID=110101 RepID=A0ABW2RIK4_9BACL